VKGRLGSRFSLHSTGPWQLRGAEPGDRIIALDSNAPDFLAASIRHAQTGVRLRRGSRLARYRTDVLDPDPPARHDSPAGPLCLESSGHPPIRMSVAPCLIDLVAQKRIDGCPRVLAHLLSSSRNRWVSLVAPFQKSVGVLVAPFQKSVGVLVAPSLELPGIKRQSSIPRTRFCGLLARLWVSYISIARQTRSHRLLP
jgi:hypothetical protein